MHLKPHLLLNIHYKPYLGRETTLEAKYTLQTSFRVIIFQLSQEYNEFEIYIFKNLIKGFKVRKKMWFEDWVYALLIILKIIVIVGFKL